MPALPEDPHQRRVAISQLIGFIGLPVVVILTMLALLVIQALR